MLEVSVYPGEGSEAAVAHSSQLHLPLPAHTAPRTRKLLVFTKQALPPGIWLQTHWGVLLLGALPLLLTLLPPCPFNVRHCGCDQRNCVKVENAEACWVWIQNCSTQNTEALHEDGIRFSVRSC